MPCLLVIIASTRPGRVGKAVAEWIVGNSAMRDAFEIEVADLAELKLPLMDEASHPSLQSYQHEHTRAWSEMVAGADAYLLVMPEYNFGYTAPLKNALDYLYVEWQYKPVAFVSYGGVAGGTRAVQMIKQVVTTLKMFPVKEGVIIPFVANRIDHQGLFASDDGLERQADAMIVELQRMTSLFQSFRVTPETARL